jgi:PKD repeat protein
MRTDTVSGDAPLTVSFGAGRSTDADGVITDYEWDLDNDGIIDAIGVTASHTYDIDGVYTAVLTVTDDQNATDTDTTTITVTKPVPPPVIDFSAVPLTGEAPLSVAFTSLNAGGPISQYRWNFGDGSLPVPGQNPVHIFRNPGIYTVELRVQGAGGSDQEIKQDYITVTQPQDVIAPIILRQRPQDGAVQVPSDANIKLHLRDAQSGVDWGTISMTVNGNPIAMTTGNIRLQKTDDAYIMGTFNDTYILYDPIANFDQEDVITVNVSCDDIEGNSMNETFSFTTEMLLIGEERYVSDRAFTNSSVAVDPNKKIIYIAHELISGNTSQIYLTKSSYVNRKDVFGVPKAVSQSNATTSSTKPYISVDPASGELYLAHVRADGLTGEEAVMILSSQDDGITFNRLHRISMLGESPVEFIKLHVRNAVVKLLIGCRDRLYFVDTRDISQKLIVADENAPHAAIKCDTLNKAHIMLEKNNIIHYAAIADGDNSSPVSRPLMNGSSPSFDVSPNGMRLYLAYEANNNVYFTRSQDAGGTFSAAIDVSDDTGGVTQRAPALAIDHVRRNIFITFEDERFDPGDIYLTYLHNGGPRFKTDILVNGDNTNLKQENHALMCLGGRLYIFFKDAAGKVCLAKNTIIESINDFLKEQNLDATIQKQGVEINVPGNSLDTSLIVSVGDVNAPPRFENARGAVAVGEIYDFGPGGTQFTTPVTIRIPYTAQDLIDAGVSSSDLTIYTYNLQTLMWEELPNTRVYPNYVEGETTHFSFFGLGGIIGAIVAGGGGAAAGGGFGGGGGGGGCHIATASYGSVSSYEVKTLCEFREKYLYTNKFGNKLVRFYQRYSPPVAEYIRNKKYLKVLVRALLKPLVKIVEWVT